MASVLMTGTLALALIYNVEYFMQFCQISSTV